MPTDAPGEHTPAPRLRSTGPLISVGDGHVVITGSGFLPACPVTVRITCTGEDVVDYLTYSSDDHGYVSAALPESAVTHTGHIAVTDHRADPDGGVLWSNTVIVTTARR
jgi:hypothetical protein